MKTSFKGTGIALVTPFQADGSVDYEGLARVIEHCIEGGVEYLVSLGTTGESVVLTEAEQNRVLDFTIATARQRVKIVAGMGGNNTAEVVAKMHKRNFDGIDAILSVSPYYNKPTQEGIFQHYLELAKHAPRPIIIYNVPGRTGSNVKAETTLRLAHASDKFVAVKEASGDIRQVMEIIQKRPAGFEVLSGDDNLTLPILACGGDGVISVVGQAYPREFSDMVRAGLRGDNEQARELHYLLMQFTDMLFMEGNPAGIKAALQLLHVCEQHLRLPLVPVSSKLYHDLQQEIQRIRTFRPHTV